MSALYSLAVLSFLIVGYMVASVRIINEGNEALVERLGRFKRKLEPGLNFIVPVLDTIVLEDTTREQVLDILPQSAITSDNVSLKVDAVVFWRILDLDRMYYRIENVEKALEDLVLTTLRSEIGKMKFEETFASRAQLNQELLEQLDEATHEWGVKVIRVEVQSIVPSQAVLESMERQQAAEIQRRAAVLEAEGDRQATLERTQATVDSIERLAQVLRAHGYDGSGNDILRFLVAQRYVEANQKLGESENSKVVFMDPKALNEAIVDLMEYIPNRKPPGGSSAGGNPPASPPPLPNGNGGNGSGGK